MQNVEMADEISFTKGQFVVACINILVRSQSFFPKMTRIAFQNKKITCHPQIFCLPVAGSRAAFIILLSIHSALQNILEKSVRELGAIRLIDSRVGVPGQLACNPRVILGRFRTTIRFAWLHILVLLVNIRLYSIHSDIHRTSGSLGHRFCWTRNTDAAGLAGVASDRHHRWLVIFDFASRTGHRAVVC
jgi:hypothetical protein